MANYSQGAQVEHSKFGLGTVMSSTDERIVIRFDDHGEKKFVTSIVAPSLKKSDRQPPAEKRGGKRKAKAAPVVVAPVEIADLDIDLGDIDLEAADLETGDPEASEDVE